MEKTLLDMPIERAILDPEMVARLRESGFSSVGSVLSSNNPDVRKAAQLTQKEAESIRKKCIEYGNVNGFSWEAIREKSGELIGVCEASRLLKCKPEVLIKTISEGKSDDITLIIGKDIVPKKSVSSKYVFKLEGIKTINTDYKALPVIASELGLNYKTLATYGKKGLLDEAKFSRGKWNVEWIKNNFYNIRRYQSIQAQQAKRTDYWNMLNDHQRTLIDEYIAYRKDFKVVFGSKAFSRFKKDDAHLEHKQNLVRFFYRIICQESGIDGFWKVNAGPYRKLSKEERDMFNPNMFDPYEISDKHIKALTIGKESLTNYSNKKYIAGFFYYLLMKEKEKISKEERETNSVNQHERLILTNKAEMMEEAFEKYMFKDGVFPNQTYRSVFLDRLPITGMIKKTFGNANLRDNEKCTAILVLAFMGCVRPVEIRRLELHKHFDLDPDTGLLKIFEIAGNKVGRIRISKDISKMSLSPSGDHGTLIPLRAVKYINIYLEKLYKVAPESRGVGYVFRPYNMEMFPDTPYATASGLFNWMNDHKYIFEGILSAEDIADFSAYDCRHTGNNLIVKQTYFSNPILEMSKEDVARYHLRHKEKGVNQRHYQQKVSLETYASVISGVWDFPFDEQELINWEDQMFQRKNEKKDPASLLLLPRNESVVEFLLTTEQEKAIQAIDKQIEGWKQQQKALGKAKEKDIHSRLAENSKLQKQIEELTKKKEMINKMGV